MGENDAVKWQGKLYGKREHVTNVVNYGKHPCKGMSRREQTPLCPYYSKYFIIFNIF